MIILLLLFFVGMSMIVEAASIAIVGAMFLHTGLFDGWAMAWDRPGWLLVFAVCFSSKITYDR